MKYFLCLTACLWFATPAWSQTRALEEFNRGATLRQKGDNQGAAKAFSRAIATDPGNAEAWRQRGLCNVDLGRHNEALADFERAIAVDPKNAHAYIGRAFERTRSGDLKGAVTDCSRAIELDPTYSNAYMNRAANRRNLGDLPGALTDLEKAIQVNPRNAPAIYSRGFVKAELNDQAGARADYALSLEVEPNGSYSKAARQELAKLPATPAQSPAARAPVEQARIAPTPTPVPLPSLPIADPGPDTPRAAIPEGLNINSLTPARYTAVVTASKEAMRLLYGPMPPEDLKKFDSRWAPLFEYPCQPVIEYFNKLNPLLNKFLAARAAIHAAMVRFSDAYEEAIAAAGAKDENGVREAMELCGVFRKSLVALDAQLIDTSKQIESLGEPPDPLTHRAGARKSHQDAVQAVRALPIAAPATSTGAGAKPYWVMSGVKVATKANDSGGTTRYTFNSAEGFAAGSMNYADVDQISKQAITAVIAGSVRWKMARLAAEGASSLVSIPYSADVQCTQYKLSANYTNDPYEGMGCGFLAYKDSGGNWSHKAEKRKPSIVKGVDGKLAMMFDSGSSEWASIRNGVTSLTFDVTASTLGGKSVYTYTYERRPLTPAQVAEIQGKADALDQNAEATQQAAAAQNLAAQWDAAAKSEAIVLCKANQVYFEGRLKEFRNSVAATPAERDRFNYLIMATEANLQAERDDQATMETGQWTHTRTGYDDWNLALMNSQSQQSAREWSSVMNAQAAAVRLVHLLPPDSRYAKTTEIQGAISSSIANGDMAGIVKIVQGLADEVKAKNVRTSEINQRASDYFDYAIPAAEVIRSAADKSMLALSMVTGPVGTGLYAGYMGATGYIDGGLGKGVKQAVSSLHPVAMVLVESYDGYNQRVTNATTGKIEQAGAAGAAAAGVKTAAMVAVIALGMQKVVGPVISRYFRGGKGNPNAVTVEQQLGQAKMDSRMANGRAKVSLLAQREAKLGKAIGEGASEPVVTALRNEAKEVAMAIKCDYAAKMVLNQAAKAGGQAEQATMTRYLAYEKEAMQKVQSEFEGRMAKDGWAPQPTKQFSNSASSGKAGMDVDLGVVEPPRFLFPKGPNGRPVRNAEWDAWRKTVTRKGPDGVPSRQSVQEFQEAGQKHLQAAFDKVYGGPGRPTGDAGVNFTTSLHSESYANLPWIGKEGLPHADFDNIHPASAQQAGDVTGFKLAHAGGGASPSAANIPDYLRFQEQCRTLAKDMNTKLIGKAPVTPGAPPPPAIHPKSPLATANKGVQDHMLRVRDVLDDFAGNRIGPIEAERRVKELTGGQGLPSVVKEFQDVLMRFGR